MKIGYWGYLISKIKPDCYKQVFGIVKLKPTLLKFGRVGFLRYLSRRCRLCILLFAYLL